MVRTVADGRKAVGSKAPRKQFGGCGGGSGGSSSTFNSGSTSSNNPNFGLTNHAKMWPTPAWQKGIGSFFKKCERSRDDDVRSTSSSSSCHSSIEGEGSMEADEDGIAASSSSGAGSSGLASSSNCIIYSDDEDKENTDPASLVGGLKGKYGGRSSRSDSGSPSPKMRRANGKQKASLARRKKRAVLQEDSDYEVEQEEEMDD